MNKPLCTLNESSPQVRSHLPALLFAAAVAFTMALSPALSRLALGHYGGASAAGASSALSALPVAVSVAIPVGLLSAGAVFTVVSVATVAEGTLWVLKRTSDGAQASFIVSGQIAAGASVVTGAAVLVVAGSFGWMLSVAGELIALIPNELGKALLYNERITR